MPHHPIELRGERLHLLPERTIHWPARRVLLVADLHWGKDESFRRRGLPLPQGVLAEDLARLKHCIDATDTETIYILGDLIHHRDGMSRTVVEQVAAWRQTTPVRMRLITGNHDRHFPLLPEAWRIESAGGQLELGPFLLVHDPLPPTATSLYRLGGHHHPMARLDARNDTLRLPAFILDAEHGVLPAFSRFTGGSAMAIPRTARAYAIGDDAVHPLQA